MRLLGRPFKNEIINIDRKNGAASGLRRFYFRLVRLAAVRLMASLFKSWGRFMVVYPIELRWCQHIKTNGTQCGSPALTAFALSGDLINGA